MIITTLHNRHSGTGRLMHLDEQIGAIPTSQLAVVPGDIDSTAQPVVQTGRYMVMVGNQSATCTIR
jgi:hypothetical protein